MTQLLANPTAVLSCIPIYTIIPKVEIRDVTKSPRDLAFGPAWFTDLSMMFEKDFFNCVLDSWPNSPIKVGIPMPQGWPYLVTGLKRFTRRDFRTIFANWDAKQYDRSHPIELTLSWYELLELFDVLKETLSETLKEVAWYVHFWSCFRLVLLPDGRIVLVMAGIYSGDVSTTNKNSLFHIMRLAICWRHIFGTLDGFRAFVRTSGLALFGDDGICAAHCEKHVYFLENLGAAWEACYGAELKITLTPSISEVSFLGKRALGDDSIACMYPVSADLDRQIASLVLKTKKGQTPVQRLSKLVAHRLLLCGFAINLRSPLTDDTAANNDRGADLLRRLDDAIKDHLIEYSQFHLGDPEWSGLLYAAQAPPEELFAQLMYGHDTISPELLALKL